MVDSWWLSGSFVRLFALAALASLPMGITCFVVSWITPPRGVGQGCALPLVPVGLGLGVGLRLPRRGSCDNMKNPLFRHPQSESKSRLFMSIASNDPFQVLGLEEPMSDVKVIRRAYKRMAVKYHPDVATTKDRYDRFFFTVNLYGPR
jgi:hypothetical protein